MKLAFTILGQPCSKANSRQLVQRGDRIIPIKSKAALAYEKSALQQVPWNARQRLEGPVKVTLLLFYKTELPDLDESIVLDVLQDRTAKNPITGERELVQRGVYRNDRQVREKHVYHFIDRANPRAEIIVETMIMQQQGLTLDVAPSEKELLREPF